MLIYKLPPFQNVAASQTAILPNMPIGMTYVGILFKLTGTFTKAQMTSIRQRLDGKQFVNITGTHLDNQNTYMNIGASASYHWLGYGDLQALTIGGQLQGAIDTSVGYRSFEMEVDIGAATTPGLAAWAVVAPPKAANDPNRLTIRAMLKSVHSLSTDAEFSLPIPLGTRAGALIDRVFFHHAGGFLSKLQITKDGLWLMQEGEEALLDFMQALKNRTNVANLLVADFAPFDNKGESISTLRGNGNPAVFEFKATIAGSSGAGDTITAYSNLLTTLDRV